MMKRIRARHVRGVAARVRLFGGSGERRFLALLRFDLTHVRLLIIGGRFHANAARDALVRLVLARSRCVELTEGVSVSGL